MVSRLLARPGSVAGRGRTSRILTSVATSGPALGPDAALQIPHPDVDPPLVLLLARYRFGVRDQGLPHLAHLVAEVERRPGDGSGEADRRHDDADDFHTPSLLFVPPEIHAHGGGIEIPIVVIRHRFMIVPGRAAVRSA